MQSFIRKIGSLFFYISLILSLHLTNLHAQETKEEVTSKKLPYKNLSTRLYFPDFADLVEKLSSSVVNISTIQRPKNLEKNNDIEELLSQLPEGSIFEGLRDLLENQQLQKKKLTSLGSGFLISEDGYIVTNNHVIDGADEINVSLNNGDKFLATVIGKDSKTDIALLKIDSDRKFNFVSFGNSDRSRIGEWVVVFGNPFGLDGSVSVGIISAIGRDINSGKFDDFIQTDAAINKGNSGGPMFNIKGEVIGISSSIYSPSGGNVGIGFAIPVSTAIPVIKQLKEKGEVIRGWLGVSVQNVSKEMANALGMPNPKGAFVIEVLKDGPALKAGLLPTDIIIKFDDKDIDEMKTLPKVVAATAIGKKSEITIIRNGEIKVLTAVIEKMQDDQKPESQTKKSPTDGEKEASPYFYDLRIVDLTPAIRKARNIKDNVKGVLIEEVTRDSKAAENGLIRGDIIISANQIEVESTKELEKIVKKAKKSGKSNILLFLSRNGEKFAAILPIDGK